MAVRETGQVGLPQEFYCPKCTQPVADPLMCGDCHGVICRTCGTPLERIDDLGVG